MANRVIRDWTTSESIDKLSHGAEVFFTRLIMKADDFGNYTGNWQLIKAALFPFRNHNSVEIAVWINECEAIGIVRRYKVDGKDYLHIPNFGQRLRTMSGKYPQPADICPHVADNPPPETKGNEGEGEGKPRSKVSDEYYQSQPEAFESMKLDDQYIEDCILTLSGRGWRTVEPLDVIAALKQFLNGKADLTTSKKNVQQHFKNWIIREKLENLQTYSQVFKTSLNGTGSARQAP